MDDRVKNVIEALEELAHDTTVPKNVKGKIVSIDDLSMTLKTEKGTLIVPIKKIVDSQIEIQD